MYHFDSEDIKCSARGKLRKSVNKFLIRRNFFRLVERVKPQFMEEYLQST